MMLLNYNFAERFLSKTPGHFHNKQVSWSQNSTAVQITKNILFGVCMILKCERKESDGKNHWETGQSHLFCSPWLHLFDQKYSKNSEILLQYKTAVFYVNIC